MKGPFTEVGGRRSNDAKASGGRNVILALNETRKTLLASRVQVERRHDSRPAGRPPLFEPGEGLWLQGCDSVDTSLLSVPIDVMFLDEHSRVLEAVTGLRGGETCPVVAGTVSILEVPVGTIPSSHTKKGDRVAIEPVLPEQPSRSAFPVNGEAVDPRGRH